MLMWSCDKYARVITITRDAGGIQNQDPAGPDAHNYCPP